MRIQGPESFGYRTYTVAIMVALACFVPGIARGTGNHWGHYGSNLALSSVGPSSGPVAGGTSVMISGSGFSTSASVAFGGVSATSVKYISSTQLQAVTPAHASGAVSVAVVQGPHNLSATLAKGFTYLSLSSTSVGISTVSPSQGPTTGGTVVNVSGTGFQTGASVKFGSALSTAVTVSSSTQIAAMAPPGSSGTVGITVTDPNAQSATMPSAFTYTSGASVTSVSPNTGPVTGGTTVIILGSGFQTGASVTFGGIASTSVTVVSSTQIQAVSPVSPAGTVSIAVTNSGAQAETLSAAFTYYHTVSLSWTGSSSGVSGYNVYRSSTSGGPYSRLNSTLIGSPSFNDNNVQAGQTYFYVTTAVNSSNVESGYSNQAQTSIPSP